MAEEGQSGVPLPHSQSTVFRAGVIDSTGRERGLELWWGRAYLAFGYVVHTHQHQAVLRRSVPIAVPKSAAGL
jgi:hypothetical protein